MKNRRINLFFLSNKKEATHEYENKTNSTSLHNLKHHINYPIVQLEKLFLNVQRIKIDEFDINCFERDTRKRPQI